MLDYHFTIKLKDCEYIKLVNFAKQKNLSINDYITTLIVRGIVSDSAVLSRKFENYYELVECVLNEIGKHNDEVSEEV